MVAGQAEGLAGALYRCEEKSYPASRGDQVSALIQHLGESHCWVHSVPLEINGLTKLAVAPCWVGSCHADI